MKKVKAALNIETYSASALIAGRKHRPFDADKLISDIELNQQYLLAAVEELRTCKYRFLLYGHFCLLNGDGLVTRIEVDTFTTLKPDAIVLLTERPEVIAGRRKARDGITYDAKAMQTSQNEEIAYAKRSRNTSWSRAKNKLRSERT